MEEFVKIINDEEFNSKIENGSGIAVVDFFATWCGPCKMLAPVFEESAKDVGNKASFSKVDIDQCLELARKYGVSTVPTVMIFKDGKPVDKMVGFMPKQQIIEKINSNF